MHLVHGLLGLLGFLGKRPPVNVPPIDSFQLPDKLYRYFPDPSRSVVDASLNEDVMEWQRYEMEFMSEPRPAAPPPAQEGVMVAISGADGITYECLLPALPTAEPRGAEEAAAGAKRRKKRLKQWLEALQPLRRRTLVHRAGWWSYEFAYQKQVRQYHDLSKEEQAKYGMARDEYLLGRHVPGQSVPALDGLGASLVEAYVDGDLCVLPGGQKGPPRRTEVHYKCDSSAPMDHVQDVIEISLCNYILTVASPRLCGLAEASRPKNGLIRCFPTQALTSPPSPPFHQAPSDSEQAPATAAAEEDRADRRKRGHSLIRDVASKNAFPQFSRLVNELLTDMGDLFDESSLMVKAILSDDDDDEDDSEDDGQEEDGASGPDDLDGEQRTEQGQRLDL